MTFLERIKEALKNWQVAQDGNSWDAEHDAGFAMYELLADLAVFLEEDA